MTDSGSYGATVYYWDGDSEYSEYPTLHEACIAVDRLGPVRAGRARLAGRLMIELLVLGILIVCAGILYFCWCWNKRMKAKDPWPWE